MLERFQDQVSLWIIVFIITFTSTGGWWWALVSPYGVAPSRMVGVPASVNLVFSSGTGSPGWSRKKGREMIVCVYYIHCDLSAARPYCSARVDTYTAVCVWQNAAISGEVGVATVRRSRVSRVHEEVDISRPRLGPQLHVKHAVHSADDDRHGADTGRHPVQLSPPLCPHRSGRSVLSDGIQAGVAAGGSGVRAILCRRLRLVQDGSELRPDDLRATGSHSQP